MKLAAAIFGGVLFGGGVLPAQYCPCGDNVQKDSTTYYKLLSGILPNF